MEKIFIKKITNKEGKEIFGGEKALSVIYNDKQYNLVGDIDNIKEADCYNTNGKYIGYLINKGIEIIVTDKTKNGFIVVK